jgi:PHD/YefM family antitoxin component YafN of YafNO toxin-antitoxin module
MSTKTVSTTDLRDNMADALEFATDKNVLVVTRHGKAEKAIIDLNELEDLLAASDSDYLAVIQAARCSDELFAHEDVFGDLE